MTEIKEGFVAYNGLAEKVGACATWNPNSAALTTEDTESTEM